MRASLPDLNGVDRVHARAHFPGFKTARETST
jgi:hypothetical protein